MCRLRFDSQRLRREAEDGAEYFDRSEVVPGHEQVAMRGEVRHQVVAVGVQSGALDILRFTESPLPPRP